jgi:RNA polymerase sigma factor for flagellar operon FliA
MPRIIDSPASERQDDDEAQLWERFVRQRDVQTRNCLIERYLPLCRTVAGSVYAKRGGLEVEFLDYMQFATLGLIEAVQRFDPTLGASFATFATVRIRGSILNNLEAQSEQYTQIALRKRVERDRLESLAEVEPSGGRRRKRDVMAVLTDLTLGLALSHLLEGSGMLVAQQDEQSYRQEFYDNEQQRQLQQTLAKLVRALPDQERCVVQYHYYHGLDFTEIARVLELSKGRISQIHRQALQLVREAYASVGRLDSSA